jgi:hypothetical protein
MANNGLVVIDRLHSFPQLLITGCAAVLPKVVTLASILITLLDLHVNVFNIPQSVSRQFCRP